VKTVGVCKVSYIVQEKFLNTTPTAKILDIDNKTIRINLVIDGLINDSLYGGVATSLIFGIMLANALSAPLRIITRSAYSQASIMANIAAVHHVTIPAELEFYNIPFDVSGSNEVKVPVSPADLFVATSWWSAQAIKFVNMRQKYLYLLQEYEKIFYPVGDEHVLIDEIFHDDNMLPIVNTKVLYDFYTLNHYQHISEKGLFFEPAFPYAVSKGKFQPSKKLRLFFYARPTTPRNLFYTGLKLLDLAIQNGVLNTAEWEIVFAGQVIPNLQFCDGTKPQSLGKLTWNEYIELIRTVDCCVSFMAAPCPNYVTLELAAVGAAVLTTQYKNKKELSYYSKNIICSELSMPLLLDNLTLALTLAKDSEARIKNTASNNINKNWQESFGSIMPKLVEAIRCNAL
jgi:hypothetical protein